MNWSRSGLSVSATAVPHLVETLLRGRDPERGWTVSLAARRALLDERLSWPGNVRQLELVVERARARALRGDPAAATLEVDHLELQGDADDVEPPAPTSVSGELKLLEEERGGLEERERRLLYLALSHHGGVVAKAARALGIPRSTLTSRLRALRGGSTGD